MRGVLVLVALAALVLAAWHGWGWLHDYVAQRHAAAEENAPAPAVPAADAAVAPAPRAAVAADATGAGEPQAPAVTGEAIRRCVQPDGQLTFTNQACPAGSRAEASSAPTPPVAVRFDAGEDPSQHDASCRFLTAEIERLAYEFGQPLPPPVIDLISTRLNALRGESEQGRCVAPPKPAAVAAPSERATHKVLTETPAGSPVQRR